MTHDDNPGRDPVVPREPDADVDEEIRFHLEMRARDYRAAGLAESDARKAAARRFGDEASVAAECVRIDERLAQRTRRTEHVSAMLQDIRIATRTLLRSPASTLVACLTLALGIGGVTTLGSVVRSVVLAPLPYPNADRLVRVQELKRGEAPWNGVSVPDFLDWKAQSRSFDHIAIAQPRFGVNLIEGDESVHVQSTLVSEDLLATLGARPALGEMLGPDDFRPGVAPGVLISDGLWRRLYRADSGITRRSIEMNGRKFNVRGVMPAAFTFPTADNDLWLPLPIVPGNGYATPNGRWARLFAAYATLRPGVTLESAASEMHAIASRIERDNPGPSTDIGVMLTPLQESLVGGTSRLLWILGAASVLVLVIACANVSSLGLVRLLGRTREIGIRAAHGATHGHFARQFTAESGVVAIVAASLGAVMAVVSVRALRAYGPASFPRLTEIHVDGTILAFTAAVAMFIAAALGAAQVWWATRFTAVASLRGGHRATGGLSERRWRGAFVLTQVALAVVLMSSTTLLVVSYRKLMAVDPGFDARQAVSMTLHPRGAYYRGDAAALPTLFKDIAVAARAIPGVTSAGFVGGLPLTDGGTGWTLVPDGVQVIAGQEPSATVHVASDGYFDAIGTPLLSGRTFQSNELGGAGDVAIVNQSLARKLFGNADPIGRRVALGSVGSNNTMMTIVGVVGDAHNKSLGVASGPELFQPYSPSTMSGDLTLVVRGTGDSRAIAQAMQAAIHRIDKAVTVSNVQTLERVVSASAERERLSTAVIGAFGALALVLSTLGIFGLVAHTVATERRAIAVRRALGARTLPVLQSVLKSGLTLVIAGLALGLTLSLVVQRALRSLLFEVSPFDPRVMGLVSAGLLLVTALAALAPAIRAIRIHPATALKEE